MRKMESETTRTVFVKKRKASEMKKTESETMKTVSVMTKTEFEKRKIRQVELQSGVTVLDR